MRLIIEVADQDEQQAELLLAELVDYAVHVEQAVLTDYWVDG